jgi:hypothetical protein
MTLNYATVNGPSDFVVAAVIPMPVNGQTKSKSKTPFAGSIFSGNPIPEAGFKLNVPQGAPVLIGSLRDENGTIPAGVTVSITKPDGTVLNQATPYTNANLFVVMNNGGVTDLMVTNPDPGNWTISVEAPYVPPGFAFSFYISTLPINNIPATFDETLPVLLREEDINELRNELGLSDCTWCTFGFYALAAVLIIIIAAAAAAGIAVLQVSTAGAATPALAAAAVGTNAVIGSLFTGLAAAGDLSIGFVAAYICKWINVCPQ